MSCDPSAVSVCIMCRHQISATSTNSHPPLLSAGSSAPDASPCLVASVGSGHPPTVSHMPGQGAIHICNPCLSNSSHHLRQRHLRPSRTSQSAPQLCPLISKFAHRISKMSLSNLLLTLFLSAMLCASQVTCDGMFELRLDQFVNELNRDASGQCCGPRSASAATELVNERQICQEKCQTFFRVCFKNFQANIDAKLDECPFGQKLTPVLSDAQMSQHIIQLPIKFSWTGTFSLIIEAWNNVSTASAPAKHDKTPVLVGRFYEQRSTNLAVSSQWTESSTQQSQSTLRFSYRMQCEAQYYGANCSTKCTPRDDTFGHYSCGTNGDRICHPGWSGDYCQKAVCTACNETNGECILPGVCKCRLGWEGDNCDQCIKYPNCQHGSCIEKPYQCICKEGWGGLLCDKDLNYCTNHRPCKNGGICTNTGEGSFTCTCPPGFSGLKCEIIDDVCKNSLCQNGATCKSHASKTHSRRNYTCECPIGFEGPLCEQVASACLNNPCQNEATCVSGPSGFQCFCKRGFSGDKCEIIQKNCKPSPCLNGGTCRSNSSVSGDESYLCECPAGFSGDHCEVNINDCESNPCLNNGVCVDQVNSFTCRCADGFKGQFCEKDIDECSRKPCANHGICIDKVNDYRCLCPAGFTGKDCTVDIDECASSPCYNGGRCRDLINKFECDCTGNFIGSRCERSNSSALSTHPSMPFDEESAFSPSQLAMIIFGSIALPLAALIGLAVVIACRQWKRHDSKLKSRRDEDEARRQNEHNSVMSGLNNKCLDQCLNPSAANVIVNAFDRAPSLHHLNKCHNYQSNKVSNEYVSNVYGRHFDKSATLQHDYKATNKLLNSEMHQHQSKLALEDPYSHTYEHIQKPSNLLSCHLSNQQIYQTHAPKQSNLDIYSSPAAVCSSLKSDCPPAMPGRTIDYGHSHDPSGKPLSHSNMQNNIQIAASLQRIGCRPNSIYVIENHYSQPIYSDPKKLQATEV